MLTVYKEDGKCLGTYPSYYELCMAIMEHENVKLLPGHPDIGTPNWSFLFLSPGRIAYLAKKAGRKYDALVLKEAHRLGKPVVEIREGRADRARYFLVTFDGSIDALQEDWCLGYLYAHGWTVG
jgi:hypothetical protein